MEKGKTDEQPNHEINTDKTNISTDATRRREKQMNNPTLRIR
jgi:hypothetical protein